MTVRLLDGSEAIVEGMIAAGIRFYAGYPMAPSTGVLEHMSARLPEAGGVCINADTEIEAVNMALGAAMTGFRAATGSTGQGVSLMQEAIAECGLHETPLVVVTVGRMQQDYHQSTRGGGWGDYRTICLAPKDVSEAFAHAQQIFHLADKYRMPGILLTDGLLARTQMSVAVAPLACEALPAKDWALDGTASGTGRSRNYWTWNAGKHNTPGPGPDLHWNALARKFESVAAHEARCEALYADDAEVLVVAFGTAAKFCEYVVEDLRREGRKVGLFRPITLWPFPGTALEAAAKGARLVAVYELNAGQMVDDVRLHAPDRMRVRSIGGISSDSSGMNIGALLDAPVIRARIKGLFEEAVDGSD
jgi:2-oxoglutarate ferredoxin oxidoreductase subunit alpha